MDICNIYNLQIDFRHGFFDNTYLIIAARKDKPERQGWTMSLMSSDLYDCKPEKFGRLEQLIFKRIILDMELDIKPLEQYYKDLKEKRNGDI